MASKALALLALLTLVLAGCTGSGSGSDGTDGPTSTVGVPGDPVPDAGSVAILVVDDTQRPIGGAQVGIVEANAVAETDEGGRAVITNLAPGTYSVAATALGFTSAAKRVDVLAFQETSVKLVLEPVAIADPYPLTHGPFSGYFECRLGNPFYTGVCGLVCDIALGTACVGPPSDVYSNDKSVFPFPMQNGTLAFVGEMTWGSGSFATSKNLRLSFSFQGRSGSHWWCTGTSGSPVKWEYHLDGEGDGECLTPPYCGIPASSGTSDANSVPTLKHKLITYTNTPFGCDDTAKPSPVELAYQQRLDVYVTTFQHMLPPDGFTALPDA